MSDAWLFNGHLIDGPTGQSGGIEEVKRGFRMAGKEMKMERGFLFIPHLFNPLFLDKQLLFHVRLPRKPLKESPNMAIEWLST